MKSHRPRCPIDTCLIYTRLTEVILKADRVRAAKRDPASCLALGNALRERDAHVLTCETPRVRR